MCCCLFFFFFKQKTAYEMRISDGVQTCALPIWFVAPTVIEGLGPDCATNREEIFGPVVTLQPFDDDAQALALANAGDYGLAASIWTRDLNRAHRLAATIHAGIVWRNCWLMRALRTPSSEQRRAGQGCGSTSQYRWPAYHH